MNTMYLLGEWIKSEIQSIVALWLYEPSVKEVFKSHKINIEKFSEKFAKAIILHNIDVIKGDKEIKDCPIMNTFVTYMLKKNISSKDIFIICSKLRAAIFEKLWKSYPDFSNNLESINQIIYIFDTNLSGVLAYYDSENIKNLLQKQENIDLVHYIHRMQIILDAQKNLILKIHDNKLFLANKSLLLATGTASQKIFKENYKHPLHFINSVDVFQNIFQAHEYDKWLDKIIAENNGICLVEFFDHIANRSSTMQMSIIQIDQKNDYVLTLNTLEKNELNRANDLIFTDSLTNLANFTKFKKMIEEKLSKTEDEQLNIFMLQLKGFTLYKDTHGVEDANTLIQNVAQQLKELYPDCTAKIDTEKFAIVDQNMNLEIAKNIIEKINTIVQQSTDDIQTIGALIVRQKEDSIEFILARGNTLLSEIKIDSLQKIIEDSVILKKEDERIQAQQIFLETMQVYKNEKKTLPVTNYFLEIAIKSNAQILDVQKEQIIINVRKISLFSLHENEFVYIEMPQKNNFRAVVKTLDRIENRVVLHKFERVKSSPLDREHVHVKLEIPVRTMIISNKNKFQGALESVSINTFSIITDHIYDIKLGSELKIYTRLRTEDSEFKATVFKIIAIADRFKIIARIQYTQIVEEELVPYVSTRQMEIIKELQKKII